MVERFDVAQRQLRKALGPLSVAKQFVGLVTGSLANEVLVAADREVSRDEASAEAMNAKAPLVRPARREVRSREFRFEHVSAKARRHVREIERSSVLIDEHEVIRSGLAHLAPTLQRAGDAGRQLPPARVVGLILIERDGFVCEVQLAEL